MSALTTTVEPGVTPAAQPRPRPLTVAELQQAMRSLQGRRAEEPRGDVAITAVQQQGDTARTVLDVRGDTRPVNVVVLAAHAGAGSSTVALCLADAAAAADRPTHLIDSAEPGRSGLVAATEAELGLDGTGCWRRGIRSAVTIDRRAERANGGVWPSLDGPGTEFTVVDLGVDHDAVRTTAESAVVVVCRPTVPGVRQAERVVGELQDRRLLLAVVGSHRWAPVVRASLGPCVRTLVDGGQTVDFPIDRSLQFSGLTDRPLPWAVRSAGTRLLGLLDAHHLSAGRPASPAGPR